MPEQITKYYRKIIQTNKINTTITDIPGRTLSLLGTVTSIKAGRVKQFYGPQERPLLVRGKWCCL